MTELASMSGGRWVGLETRREAVGCRCPSGHRFSAELITTVSLLRDRALLAELLDKGVQERECPACHALCRLAEPVGVHDPEARRFALYVPESLSHRRIALLALTLEHIASLDPTATPEYFETPTLLCGRSELRRWMGSSSSFRRPDFSSQPERLLSSRVEEGVSRVDHGPKRDKMPVSGTSEIHAAFADLVNEEAGPMLRSSEPKDLENPVDQHAEHDSHDDWLADDSIEGGHHEGQRRFDQREAKDHPIDDEDEKDDALEFLSEPADLVEDTEESEAGSTSAVQSPGPTGIEDSNIRLDQGRVHLSHKVDGTVLAKYSVGRANLWFQLFEIGAFPLVTLTLVDDGRAAEPETLTWLLDLTRPEQRAIATTLQRRYQGHVQLYISSRYEPLLLELGGHRESNVSVVLDRAATMLADHSPDDRPFDRAAERFARLKKPHGNVAVPSQLFDYQPAHTFGDATHFVRLVSEWFEDERYNYLIFVRSFPLDTFEELVRRSLEQAVSFGACVPDPLVARALTLGLASSRKELSRRLIDRFATLVRDDASISDDAAVDNWSDLLRRAHADRIAVHPEVIHAIQQQVARAGRTNDSKLQEVLSKVKAGL